MRRLIFILILVGATIAATAQTIDDKLSPSTMMLLSEMKGEIALPKAHDSTAQGKRKAKSHNDFTRPIAEPEYVDGVKVVSAFLTVNNGDFTKAQALGVIIEQTFGDVATTLIPVDKVMQLAALDNVTNIEVAEVQQPHNDQQRALTRAYDALANSDVARALGITTPYTGKGVVVGVIDRGIDFQHIAFKDKDGNTRIKLAYTLNGSTLVEHSTEEDINSLTCDITSRDHGSHTASTAAGSSVIVNGSDVAVTDDHASATYGGMAPEADLVLCGFSTLYTTSMANAIGKICDYADAQGKPCVVSISIGSLEGPHDGTGAYATALRTYAGDNHIIVFSAGNDAMRAAEYVKLGTSNGGGCYATGTSTYSKPLMVNVQHSFEDSDGNAVLDPSTICAYARTAGVATSLRFHVVNTTTGAVAYTSDPYSASTTITMTGTSGLAKYFNCTSSDANGYGDLGKIRITRAQNNSKYYWRVYMPALSSTSTTTVGGIKKGNYALCVSVYPTSSGNTTVIDLWETMGCWFGNDLTLSSTYQSKYNLVKGNDDCSVSDNACYDGIISVGAYTSKNIVTAADGTITDYTATLPNLGDHCFFSGWQAEGTGPTGKALPTISGPGARIAAAVNHYHTTAVDDGSYYHSSNKAKLVVNHANYPYATNQGTSMSTPCVAGIIAQWLQACVEKGITANPDYIKEVLASTEVADEWTDGTGEGAHGAKTFGTHGKIDALAGIKYILGIPDDPTPDYFDVRISDVGLTTLYLDFPVEIPYQTYNPDLLGVYYIIGFKGKEMLAARLKSNIPANTGVIVHGNSGTYRFPKTATADALKYPSYLSGSVVDTTPAKVLEEAQASGSVYTLGRGTDSYINFYKYSGTTLHANKAFLIYDGDSGAKQLTLRLEGDATGIDDVNSDGEDGTWHTLQGIMLQGRPTQKGIYIHNGNSYIIR
ncbi:MAG: S8 family serine peptidase [Prevotella sp.]|nr:S8 family serine peptidase [Prevotella sp.]